MVQLIQFSASQAPSGTNDVSVSRTAGNSEYARQTEVAAMQMLEAELHEHRYYLERKVEERTEQLSTRIRVLETCNAALAGKLADAKKDIAMLRRQLVSAKYVSESHL